MYRDTLALLKTAKNKITAWLTANLFPWLRYRKYEGTWSGWRSFLRWYFLAMAVFAFVILCPPVHQGLVAYLIKSYSFSEGTLPPSVSKTDPGQPASVPDVVGSTTVPDTGQKLVEESTAAPAASEPAPDLQKMRSPLKGRVIANYGQFIYYDTFKEYRLHQGLDLAAPAGAAVTAALGGWVAEVGRSEEWGVWLDVDHGVGWVTRYANLAAAEITKGQTVQAGAIIGRLGNPGTWEFGSETHLHFELLHDLQPTDPLVYLGDTLKE